MDVKKILIIGIIALLAVILIWNMSGDQIIIDGVCEEVQSVDEDGTLVLVSGLRVRLLGVKENSQEAMLYIKNNIVGKTIQLQHDSGNEETYVKSDDMVHAYASLMDGSSVWRLIWNNCSDDIRTVAFVTDSLAEMNEMMQEIVLTEKSDLALYMRQRTFIIIVNDQSIGTGFFINKEGLALTNTHVISDKDEKGAYCVLYEENAEGTGLYKSRKRGIKNIKFTSPIEEGGMDITIFSVDLEPGETVPYFNLAKKHIPVGEHLGMFGNPQGLVASYTDGTLSSYHEKCPLTGRDVPMVQYNIPANHGNSGGPVADKYGQIISVCELGYSQDSATGQPVQGLNFGVDILAVRQVLDSRGLNYGGK